MSQELIEQMIPAERVALPDEMPVQADEPPEQRLARFAKLGTIDLRIDYLRPATGPSFTASAQPLRLGSRVGTTRMEFHGAQGQLLAVGAAAYIIS